MSANGQRVIEAVRAKAAEMPDYVYEGPCEYVGNGKPACLVGHALWSAGLIDEDWSAENRDINYVNIRGVNRHYGWGFDEAEVSWLLDVQHEQDTELPWGLAVNSADERAAMPV